MLSTTRTLMALVVAGLVTFSSAGAAQIVNPVTVVKGTSPRQLQFDVDVPAGIEEVWKAFSTREGMIAWLAPDAKIELRPGGDWLVMFPGAAPGGGKIEAFDAPGRIVIHAMAPEKFPEVRSVGTTATFTLTSCGNACTHVRLVQTGWKEGKEWEDAYEYLAGGNAQLLGMLYRRFVSGPQQWKD
jgi:uncharacterized protein YndB with AHSA1/START domain